MGTEEDRPDFDQPEDEDNQEDPIERFRRLTSQTPEQQEPPGEDTLGLYRAGPAPEPDSKSQISDSPDHIYGWHGRGQGDSEPPEVPEYDVVDLGEDEGTDPFSDIWDDTKAMAGTSGVAMPEGQETLLPEPDTQDEVEEPGKESSPRRDFLPVISPEERDAKPEPSQAKTDLLGSLSDTPPSRSRRRDQLPPPPPFGPLRPDPAPSPGC